MISKSVAPRAGAWIETNLAEGAIPRFVSPLAQGRGLKRMVLDILTAPMASPLAQGRGLKRLKLRGENEMYTVAPRAGAWIETW